MGFYYSDDPKLSKDIKYLTLEPGGAHTPGPSPRGLRII